MAFDSLPSGVRLLPEIISEDQESALRDAVDAGAWDSRPEEDGFRSQQFGWWRPQLLSEAGQSDRFLGALPDWAAPLVSRLHILAPFDFAPDHLVVRELTPGAHPHLRKGEGRTVATLALLADLPVMFRKREGTGTWHLTQARRSLLVLTERFDRSWDRTILPTGLPAPLPGPMVTHPSGHGPDAHPGPRLLTLTFRRVTAE